MIQSEEQKIKIGKKNQQRLRDLWTILKEFNSWVIEISEEEEDIGGKKY